MTLSELKKFVKEQNKRLSEWKTAFSEKHGKAPTKSDLRQSKDIVGTYDTYLLANPILKARKTETSIEKDQPTAEQSEPTTI